MNAILHGSLGHFPPDQLLTFFSTFSHTGTLEVASLERQARIYFSEGLVVHAESEVSGDVDEVLRDLFIWLEGTFSFSPVIELPQEVLPSARDLRVVIQEGLQRATEWKSLLQLFPSEDIGLRVVDEPQTDGKISLSPEEFKILLRVGTGRTLGRLRADLHRPALQLYPIVHRLELAGLLERIATAAAAKSVDPAAIRTILNLDPSEAQTAPRDVDVSSEVMTLVNANVLTQVFVASPVALRDGQDLHAQTTVLPSGSPSSTLHPADETATDERAFRESRNEAGPVMKLVISNGPSYELVESVYSIGRDANSVIRINDASVSGNHARILRGENGFLIEDLNSRNKTHLNGEPITAPQLLADGDELRLGKVIMTFHRADSPAASVQ